MILFNHFAAYIILDESFFKIGARKILQRPRGHKSRFLERHGRQLLLEIENTNADVVSRHEKAQVNSS